MGDFIIFGGSGMQGRICAKDLISSGYKIILVGRDPKNIQDILGNPRAEFIYADLHNEDSINHILKKNRPKVVINCAELSFNIPIMKACLENKIPYTDLGGLQRVTSDQFKFNKEFKKRKLLALTGCGSTPGIANVMAAYAVEKMERVESIYLGFAWDSNIKIFIVPYSIESIFQEFSEMPVTFHNGKFVKDNRYRCKGTFDFKEVGRQTVYCIVHSEVYTFSKYFKRKGLQHIHYMAGFPEHSMRVINELMSLGFGNKKLLEINGTKIRPIDATTRILKNIKMPKGYKERENIWVRAEGKEKGREKKIEMNCIVKSVKGWESAGSNIDTGRTISIMSQMILNGEINAYGVHAPEGVVPQRKFFKELAKRRMWVYENGRKIN
ncbi:saccharopine dehydrogenase NADP-binding domain-containing protein [Candidatus Pacearchaeota archaeon]|nr:saccharopine dehydrogenase NADP-binding domain-containing protein [Candidatus Pacearchaeota archaeon]